jgi:Ca2+-binding EF-hand superfamily protein
VSELQNLQKAFKVVDKDKSGDLDFTEFKTLMKKEMKSDMAEDSLKVRPIGRRVF